MDASASDCGRVARVVPTAATAPLIRSIQWSSTIDAELDTVAAAELLPWARRQVLEGVAQLWECRDERDRLLVITRLDFDPLEWAIVYCQGSGLEKFGAYFLNVARRKRWPLRMHTTSPATARLCERLGFHIDEYVSRCKPWV